MNAIIIITLAAIAILYLGVYKAQRWVQPVLQLSLLAALVSVGMEWGTDRFYFHNMMRMDNLSVAFSALAIVSTMLIALLSREAFERISRENMPESYAVMLFSLVGGIVMISHHNLAQLFVGLEILSVSLYVLAGLDKPSLKSNEAALKYFLLGAFATGFLLMGFALLYGATGSFDIVQIGKVGAATHAPIFYAGMFLVLAAMAFKVSAAPFHFWTPDVYQGAPTSVTMFMATVVKVAGFGAMFRIFSECFLPEHALWSHTLVVLIALTLLVGNLMAILQDNLKRMLAYSSVSHAGYLLMALLGMQHNLGGSASVMFYYLAAYAISTIGAFTIVMLVKQQREAHTLEAFRGLARTNPKLSVAMTVALCSLAGVPLTAGFVGKFYVFSILLQQQYLPVGIFAALMAVVGFYYYFRIVVAMFMQAPVRTEEVVVPSTHQAVLWVTTLATFALGIAPSLLAIL